MDKWDKRFMQMAFTIAMIALGLSMGSFIDKLITRRKMD